MTGENDNSFRRFLRFSAATDTITKNLQKYKNDKLSRFGLKSMHLMFLCCLDKAQENGLTPAELAKSCGVDKAFISRVARELCHMGYVGYADEGDSCPKYKRHLVLTENGRETMSGINKMIDEAVQRITDGIPDEKIETFYQVLELFEANLNRICTENSACI
ncbi:MAG: MarR family winged helix-turn-helix transcriptional regulator [Eubacteriales bacterium]